MRHLYVAMVAGSTYSTARGTGDYMCVKVQQHDAWKDSWTCSLLPAGSRTLWRYARRGMVRAEFTGPRGTHDLYTAAQAPAHMIQDGDEPTDPAVNLLVSQRV